MSTSDPAVQAIDTSASTKPLKTRSRTGSTDSSRHDDSRSGASSPSSAAQARGKGVALLKRPGQSASLRRTESPFRQAMPVVPALPDTNGWADTPESDRQERLVEMTQAYEASQDFCKQLELTLFNVRTTLASKTEREHHLEAELASTLLRTSQLESQLRKADKQTSQLEKKHAAEQAAWEEERTHLLAKQEQTSKSLHRLMEQQLQQRLSSGMSTLEAQAEGMPEGLERDTPCQSSSTNLFGLQMAVQQRDRRIEALEEHLATLKHELNLVRSGHHEDDTLLESQLIMLKQDYAKLLGDVEGYQILLQEKTLTGELFAQGSFMQTTGSGSGRFRSLRGRPDAGKVSGMLDLASELDATSIDLSEAEVLQEASREAVEDEIIKLQESNKALTLYINTIVVRLMNKGFEHVLARDDKDVEAAIEADDSFRGHSFRERAATVATPTSSSILSRTRSMLGAGTRSETTASSITSQECTPRAHRGQSNGQGMDSGASSVTSPSHGTQSTSPQAGYGSISSKGGLRQLASSAVADQKSQAEAKRLAALFKPKPGAHDASGTLGSGIAERGKAGAARGFWFSGWRTGPISPTSVDTPPSILAMDQTCLNSSPKRPMSEIPVVKMPVQAHVTRPETAQTK